jgi:hypothetical protein
LEVAASDVAPLPEQLSNPRSEAANFIRLSRGEQLFECRYIIGYRGKGGRSGHRFWPSHLNPRGATLKISHSKSDRPDRREVEEVFKLGNHGVSLAR